MFVSSLSQSDILNIYNCSFNMCRISCIIRNLRSWKVLSLMYANFLYAVVVICMGQSNVALFCLEVINICSEGI